MTQVLDMKVPELGIEYIWDPTYCMQSLLVKLNNSITQTKLMGAELFMKEIVPGTISWYTKDKKFVGLCSKEVIHHYYRHGYVSLKTNYCVMHDEPYLWMELI